MVAVTSLIGVLFMSLIVVRIATEALILTGLSRATARFQARSAWTGTGFTTSEAEAVVNHPVRRRIISLLMFMRSVGLVTAASTLMLSFVSIEDRGEGFVRLAVLIAALAALALIARSEPIDRWMSRVIAGALKRFSDLDARDYAGLLHLGGEYAIMELEITGNSWLANRTLADLDLPKEGVLVLGITPSKGAYVGAPRGDSLLHPDSTLILYGRSPELVRLSRRRADAQAGAMRAAAVSEQDDLRRREDGLE